MLVKELFDILKNTVFEGRVEKQDLGTHSLWQMGRDSFGVPREKTLNFTSSDNIISYSFNGLTQFEQSPLKEVILNSEIIEIKEISILPYVNVYHGRFAGNFSSIHLIIKLNENQNI